MITAFAYLVLSLGVGLKDYQEIILTPSEPLKTKVIVADVYVGENLICSTVLQASGDVYVGYFPSMRLELSPGAMVDLAGNKSEEQEFKINLTEEEYATR